jgi:hypothetical protein
MADREVSKQSLHDKAIEYYAEKYSDDDVLVKADHISGYDTPDTLNGEIPDILVIDQSRDGGRRAFEIETDESDDKEQRENLREWQENHDKRLFRWGVVSDGDVTVDSWRG